MRGLTIACLAAALLAAGCGDDDGSAATTASTATQAQTQPPPTTQGGAAVEGYRAELREQRADIERQIERLGDPDAATPAALADYFDEIIELSREQQRDFEAVEAPRPFADRHREAVRLGQAVLRLTKRFATDLREGDDPAQLLESFGPKVRDAAQRSNEFYEVGVPACRVDPTTGVIGGEES